MADATFKSITAMVGLIRKNLIELNSQSGKKREEILKVSCIIEPLKKINTAVEKNVKQVEYDFTIDLNTLSCQLARHEDLMHIE